MKDRKGIILLLFDLPAVSAEDKREYSRFKKKLKSHGFLQLQESCYLKLVRNISSFDQTLTNLSHDMPISGTVCALPMNLNEFKGMRFLLGGPFNISAFTDDVVCIGGEAGGEGNDSGD